MRGGTSPLVPEYLSGASITVEKNGGFWGPGTSGPMPNLTGLSEAHKLGLGEDWFYLVTTDSG